MYETFEHTADLGLRVVAPDVNALFAEAGAALFSALVDDVQTIRPVQSVELHLAGDDLALLLIDWMRELLFHFDHEHLLLGKFQVQVGADGLAATAWGEPFDPSRHALSHEVKAITYHGLRVEAVPEGWLAEVIVDI